MAKGFGYTQICIVKSYVFTDESNGKRLFRMVDCMDHLLPVFHMARFVGKSQLFDDNLVKTFLLHKKRHFINAVKGLIFNNGILINITEQGQFFFHFVR